MLAVHGINLNTDEHKAALALAKSASQALPEINESSEIVLEIFSNVQCFGQKVKDIDLIVFFADYRRSEQLIRTSNGKTIHSFCCTIEVKSHSFDSVWFVGTNCYVRYNSGNHDVTLQSENQKYSVKNYIERNSGKKKAPWIINLIWLINLTAQQLPRSESNILGADVDWFAFLERIALLAGGAKERVETFSSRKYLNSITSIFSLRLEASKIDRRRIESITKSVLDRDQKRYAEKLGKQLLIIRGRGGTGKTVRLIQIANQAYDEYGRRVILLTYNKALVADITRLLTIRGVRNSIGERGMAVRTIYSFMYEWLSSLNIISRKCPDFLERYEDYKNEALELLHSGALSADDIKITRTQHSRDLEWDLLLIDESQDWPCSERDLIYLLYNPDSVVIADGIDQFVRGVDRIDWREGIPKSQSQVIRLRKSMRLKAALCQVVQSVAEEISLQEWDLEPLPEAYGGKVYVVVGNGLSPKFHSRIFATANNEGNKPVDMLFCVPPTWVEEVSDVRESVVAKLYRDWGKQVWDAVDPTLRGEYPTSLEQYRIVQYESCRGLEGWVVVCFALDDFFECKRAKPEISNVDREKLFFNDDESASEYAKRWLMIPLTRAIDTLVIHIRNPHSYIAEVFRLVREKYPETVQWLSYE